MALLDCQILCRCTNIKIGENVTELHMQILGDLLKNIIAQEKITNWNELQYFISTKFGIFDTLANTQLS